ncbi:MAG: hypothetical protein ACFFB2_02890 [Promethearchaeota archaeon]
MLQKEVNRLKEKINSLNQHLLTYEKEFLFSSEDFQEKWNSGELGDDQIFFELFADLETRDRIKKRLELLEKVKLDK